MMAWGSWDETAFDAYLPSNMILSMADIAVIVADRLTNLLYMNEYAAKLFRLPGDAAGLAGQPILSLGLVSHGDLRQVEDMTALVLRGRSWEGTFESMRGDGSHALMRALAVPLRHPAGDVDGIVILAREVSQRAGRSAEDRLALLERVGERLAGSLEINHTLRHVAEILVPQFADHCFIDLFQGDVLIRRIQRHANDWTPQPGTWAEVGQQIHYPEGHFCQLAMAHLDTVIRSDLDTSSSYHQAPSEASADAAREAGLTSAVAAPLYARGVLLGVMSLALSRLTDRAERTYDTPDGDLIGAIASRVAVAIDNSMLFETERQTALAFQKSLLPQAIPEIDGLEVACRYVPAKPLETQGQGIQTQVGGDWYDIIPLAAGRVGIVIGDVEGRGARAAATMGQLRAALRAFAQDEKSPADIMRKLDEWCRSLAPSAVDGGGGDPPTASCIYMIYDAWSRELTFANAGHDAPMMVSDGEARQLEFRHKGVLLGVRGKGIRGLPTYKEETILVPPGATLVFYTDGLTDRRTRADGSGHYTEAEAAEMLRHAVRAAAASGDADVVATAAEYAVPGDIDDDMAILVAKSSPEELASIEQVFPAEPIMVSEARRLAAQTFRSWGMAAEQTELACLLVSEVVTNAVLHASITPSPGRRFDLDLESVVMPEAVLAGEARPDAGMRAMHDASLQEQESRDRERGGPAKEFALRLRRGATSVWVEVFDPDLRLPRIRTAGETDEGGRGLYLVEQLATRWGSRPTPEGKAVWFELPRSASRP
jgi:serine phosphatase RsbU (regulator of sigma subunit)